MYDKLNAYRHADSRLPSHNRYWPLYGAGFENLGCDQRPIDGPVPQHGSDELLVRHDACGLCFSDIKVIRAGEKHPRIYRDMQANPVVLGHEVSLTVAGVGENLRDRYRVGDRFIMQADIYVDGVSFAYGYEIQGGLSRYSVIDRRVLDGDHGCYLVPIQPQLGYAEAALTEPWACVEASYNVVYRTHWRVGGLLWLVGDGQGVGLGRAIDWRPSRVVLEVSNAEFSAQVRAWVEGAGVEIVTATDDARFDDIVVLSSDVDLIEQALPRLSRGGMLGIIADARLARPVRVDIGRLHYDHQTVVGSRGPDLSTAYGPIRSQLKPRGRLWVLGAAGPMGHMHIQRSLEVPGGPGKIVATNLRQSRIHEVEHKFAAAAKDKGVALLCLSQEPLGQAGFASRLQMETSNEGFDDIVVLAPSVSAVENAVDHLAAGGVMNVFAGLARGTMAALDLNGVVARGVRFTGTSGSSIQDLLHMRDLTQSRTLSPNRSVAAIVGLEGAFAGLHAVSEGRFPGKVVVYPNVKPFPLTPLSDLQEALPSVYAKLDGNREWTVEAEDEFLRLMLR